MKAESWLHELPHTQLAVVCAVAIGYLALSRGRRRKKAWPRPSTEWQGHNLSRMALITRGRVSEFTAQEVTLKLIDDFTLNTTIFKSVSSPLSRLVLHARLGVEPFYSSQSAQRIVLQYTAPPVPKGLGSNTAIYSFMKEHCDFSCEHADGSFMDHLQFCHDYSAVHFAKYSPRVLLLHSILGVGTNIFPIRTQQIPELEGLLTPFERLHISAFPSFLRLISVGLVDTLKKLSPLELSQIEKVHFHRVIDNLESTLSAEDFWIHLNYHLIHFLDFLPAAAWKPQQGDPLFQMFVELYDFLKHQNKVQCNLDFSLTSPGETVTVDDKCDVPLTLGTLVSRHVPKKLARTLANKTIRKYSSEVRHSLKCTFEFKSGLRKVLVH